MVFIIALNRFKLWSFEPERPGFLSVVKVQVLRRLDWTRWQVVKDDVCTFEISPTPVSRVNNDRRNNKVQFCKIDFFRNHNEHNRRAIFRERKFNFTDFRAGVKSARGSVGWSRTQTTRYGRPRRWLRWSWVDSRACCYALFSINRCGGGIYCRSYCAQ